MHNGQCWIPSFNWVTRRSLPVLCLFHLGLDEVFYVNKFAGFSTWCLIRLLWSKSLKNLHSDKLILCAKRGIRSGPRGGFFPHRLDMKTSEFRFSRSCQPIWLTSTNLTSVISRTSRVQILKCVCVCVSLVPQQLLKHSVNRLEICTLAERDISEVVFRKLLCGQTDTNIDRNSQKPFFYRGLEYRLRSALTKSVTKAAELIYRIGCHHQDGTMWPKRTPTLTTEGHSIDRIYQINPQHLIQQTLDIHPGPRILREIYQVASFTALEK